MKLIEKYNYLKGKYCDYIVLLKSGSFYVTFASDALIMNKIFKYQVVNGKIGFPINAYDKVLKELENNNINYVIINSEDKEEKEFCASQNDYVTQFGEAKKYEFKNNLNNLLIEKIKFLLENNPDNYDKIRRFIDEL